jgi:hypothetical protein
MGGCAAAIDPAVIADARTAALVKTALVNDPDVGELAIEVRVIRGTAYLSGRVRSSDDADRALTLARAVPGVTGVQSTLQVGDVPLPEVSDLPLPPAAQDLELSEIESSPGLFALGAALGRSVPRAETLRSRLAISPLVKIGSPRGLGFAIAFNWFQADLAAADGAEPLTRIHVKPVMLGAGYTWAAERVSFAPALVAGYAFNSLTITETGEAQELPVEIGNSFAWRPGVSAWYDVNRRMAVNVSVAYVMTGVRLTIVKDGRLERRDASADAAILHVGLAYKLF